MIPCKWFCTWQVSLRQKLMTRRRICVGGVFAILSLLSYFPISQSFQSRIHIATSPELSHPTAIFAADNANEERNVNPKLSIKRRETLIAMATATTLFPFTTMVQATSFAEPSLEDLQLGQAQWTLQGPSGRSASSSLATPPIFSTYLARFLINYDEGVASWWYGQLKSVSLLSPEKQQRHLGQSFGKFASSLKQALDAYLAREGEGYSKLFERLLQTYRGVDAPRHIGVLCALLPPDDQPGGSIRQLLLQSYSAATTPTSPMSDDAMTTASSVPMDDFSELLPSYYHISLVDDKLILSPPLPVYQVGVDRVFGIPVTSTPFGPLSSEVLTRELPSYSMAIYAVLGVSGATGCAMTHALVIPLDVVKTKAQTDPGEYSDVVQGAAKIVRDEGWQGLLTGAEATLVGYFWYGLSVYPSYTFVKRYLGQSLFTTDWVMAHTNSIALVAGACAAVVASLGLTPLEAARIRVVADPSMYKPLGLIGTLQAIGSEGEGSWTRVYAGLPSLLSRQVIFGSIKFLAFERACDVIYTTFPSLRDTTWTALAVSLVAGGFSGTFSSVVSQPADAVLTYVARSCDSSGKSLGLLQACQTMVEEDGLGSLFRGLGSRCLWAGSIIAGQFLLYDVFRTLFGVTANDLSEVFQVEI